jgi:membrane protease YdiL (CAAX protease family)
LSHITKKIAVFVLLSVLTVPVLAYAQLPPPPNGIDINKAKIESIARTILEIVWIGAVVFVVIAFITIGGYFLLTKGEPDKFREARNALIWAIIGVAVMVLAFSIITVVVNILLGQ